ncbi:MAG: hypothetical protein JWP57_1931 [Spirosoma sp.]|nr:hypothetical protein [Spirosoma sp.]
MHFNDLAFEPHEYHGFLGKTGYQAIAWFTNGFGLSVRYGSMFELYDGEYDVLGLAGNTTYTEDLPSYFRAEETSVSAERVSQILHEIEALPPRGAIN